MRKLLVGLTSITSAVAAYTATRRKLREPITIEPEGFEWIDADEPEVLEPLYDEGEYVITYNPYTQDYVLYDLDFTPLYMKVEDVAWDEEDGEFRYKLEHEDQWFAESWLMEPDYPMMEKELDGDDENKTEEDENMPKNAQNRIFEKSELTRRKEWKTRSDELLDAYNAKLKEGEVKEADKIMETYRKEYALFQAGSLIREAGGELGGERKE